MSLVSGMWGNKIGMTQLFEGDKVVPVTVINVGNWVVTGIKTKERDGYNAVQIGNLRKRFYNRTLAADWTKKPYQYCTVLREIRVTEFPTDMKIGNTVDLCGEFQSGDVVDVHGVTKGRGYAGVVKRWNFRGPPSSHGHTMGKKTGSLGFMRSRGRVIKGKKMPGHMGVASHVIRNMDIVKVDRDGQVLLVVGSVPGHNGSLVFVRRHV